MSVFVTGMGVISSIGNTIDENLHALLNSTPGITSLTSIKNMRKPFIGGQVKLSNHDLINALYISPENHAHRSTLLGLHAAREAWGNRKLQKGIRTGIIYGTTIGSIDIDDDLLETLVNSTENKQKINYRKIHEPGFGTDFIGRSIGIENNRFTISTACSTGANAIMMGARLIKAGKLDRVLVGGAECITNYTLNGFDSLMLYSNAPCMPFDEDRKGLNLGEGSGFLVLENEQSIHASGSKKTMRLTGWANTCDAYHITASSPAGIGASLAIEKSLAMAKIKPNDIDYINAHGTGTPNNDLSEYAAMQTVFGNDVPYFGSTKSYTGHTLAAAGAIESVYTILAMQNNTVFPTLSINTPLHKMVSPNLIEKNIKNAVSNSFGFGGNCTALVFEK
jgi:3-oxoacyl-(acyl-carrier-protein) synthase